MRLTHLFAALAWFVGLTAAPAAHALGSRTFSPPTYDLNFSTSSYSGPSGAIANPFAGEVSVSRASVAQTPDNSGHYTQTASGQPRLSDRGLMIEASATNKIRNNSSTGAVAGAAGTYTVPNGWIAWSNVPTGISIDLTLVTDATTGFACRRWRFYGTATQAKSTITLGIGAATDIAGSAGDFWITTGFMRKAAGHLPQDLQIYLRQGYYATASLLAPAGTERLMNRDTLIKRFVTPGLTAPSTTNRVEPQIVVGNFNNGQTYDFAFDECAEQTEQVTSVSANPTSPILTINAAVTRQADVVTLGGGLLSAMASPTGTFELTTNFIRSGQVGHDLLTVNGSIVILRRGPDGSISSSGITGAPTTSRGYRLNYAWDQTHLVSWSPSSVKVATTAVGTTGSVASSVPSISTATLGADGFIKELKFAIAPRTDLTSYTTRTGDVVVYGATSGGLAAALAASRQGMRVIWIGAEHEICVGGMTACGGLGQLDMAAVAKFGGEWIQWLECANEQEAQTSLVQTIPEPKDMGWCMEQALRQEKLTVLWSTGVATVSKNGTRLASFTTVDGITVKGKEFIDASYEGDLMVRAGVTYTYGREAANQVLDVNGKYPDFDNGYLGILAGSSSSDSYDQHNFDILITGGHSGLLTVDPWSEAGNSSSSLLLGVISNSGAAHYTADSQLQAYMYRMNVTDGSQLRVAFPNTPPNGYDPKTYELLGRYLKAATDGGAAYIPFSTTAPTGSQFGLQSLFKFSTIGKAPTGGVRPSGVNLYDLNAANGFSLDRFGSNWGTQFAAVMSSCGFSSPSANYALASYAERDCYRVWQQNFQLGLWYWLQYDGLNEQAALIATPIAGGSSCSVGERLKLVVPNTDFSVVVSPTSVSGGAVTAAKVLGGVVTRGQSPPSNPLTISTASASCSGATFNLTWGSRLPAQLNSDALNVGYINDYYLEPFGSDPAGFPYQVYVREGVRMVGAQVAHVNDTSAPDGLAIAKGDHVISLASYALDSHHTQTIAWNNSGTWMTLNSGEFGVNAGATGASGGMGANLSAPILLDYITPQRTDATNLLVTFAISATHAANSALRMEAAHVTTSYAAGLAAAQAVAANDNEDIQDVDYTVLRRKLEVMNVPSYQVY